MATISDKAAQALRGAICTKGKNKGLLLAKAPPFKTLSYAAWQAAVLIANPYKASIPGIVLMNDEQRAIYNELVDIFEAIGAVNLKLDRDRNALDALGAW